MFSPDHAQAFKKLLTRRSAANENYSAGIIASAIPGI
jgi:hypothetical protein